MKRILFCFLILACLSQESIDYTAIADRNFREDMRRFVIEISRHARSLKPDFAVIPQNGHDLLLDDGLAPLRDEYLKAIQGVGQEELFFGLGGMNKSTPEETHNWMMKQLGVAREHEKQVLVIDYCKKKDLIDQSYYKNHLKGFISYAATERGLTNIPGSSPYNVNSEDIKSIKEAKNFLYLINTEDFPSKSSFIEALKKSEYDLMVLDLFHYESILTPGDVAELKEKPQGGRRQVICYMSVGEAEDYRFYWQKSWKRNKPSWLDLENPHWPGNYKVRYWEKDWQDLIIYNEDSYLNMIINTGFDGVYLDIIDGFWYFEEVLKE